MGKGNLEDKFFEWINEIPKLQTELNEIKPNHPLLKLVNVNYEGIEWDQEFNQKYPNKTDEQRLDLYVQSLKTAIHEFTDN